MFQGLGGETWGLELYNGANNVGVGVEDDRGDLLTDARLLGFRLLGHDSGDWARGEDGVTVPKGGGELT